MNTVVEAEGSLSLIDEYLLRQRELTAVDTFARRGPNDKSLGAPHEAHDLPAQAGYYRELLPASPPGPGQQYAFEVDLDACSGCKACVAACHTLNGLDDDETWRDVGLLVGGAEPLPIVQHITSACHHCLEPACMEGCPVLAYEKDPLTGIVRHLDDQCIGCQYCVLKCPYDVPKYNSRLGIVRKCDMCSGRLAVGEAPACAQGCPNEAIRITIVDRQKVIDASEANVFLPGAAEPDYTLPTTTYQSARALPRNTLPADYYRLSPGHAHLSLVVMLVLTQLSVGAFVIAELMTWNAAAFEMAALRPAHAAVALALGLIALGASTLHLGRPLYAFRAVIGLRTSWLSREILAFALFATLAAAYAAISWVAPRAISPQALRGLGVAVAAAGMLGVFCSVMIYHDTRRAFWRARYTGPKFFLSALLLGTVTTLLTMAAAASAQQPAALRWLETTGRAGFGVVAAISALKVMLALLPLRHLRDRQHTPMKRTARLAVGPLLRPVLGRFLLAAVGGILLPLLALAALPQAIGKADLLVMAAASFALTLISELLERYLFFAAAVAPKMPGGQGA